jgi:hypothetical protein
MIPSKVVRGTAAESLETGATAENYENRPLPLPAPFAPPRIGGEDWVRGERAIPSARERGNFAEKPTLLRDKKGRKSRTREIKKGRDP